MLERQCAQALRDAQPVRPAVLEVAGKRSMFAGADVTFGPLVALTDETCESRAAVGPGLLLLL